jgi:hypothetical protein
MHVFLYLFYYSEILPYAWEFASLAMAFLDVRAKLEDVEIGTGLLDQVYECFNTYSI